MTQDAKFEDGTEKPLFLGAETAEDVAIISALCQDAIFTSHELKWDAKGRRFVVLLNRFRWENHNSENAPERVQTLLIVDDVLRMASQGVDIKDKDSILSLLELRVEQDEQGAFLILQLAGDGALRANIEAINMCLRDVTRPYHAPSGKMPTHPEHVD